jgi:opacity protein-like surface antigen
MKQKILMFLTSVLMLITYGLVCTKAAVAEGKTTDNNSWQFEITPYFFGAGMEGAVGMSGVSADVDMSFSDIWDRLDKAFMLFFTAQKEDWIFAFDGIYFKLDDEKAASWLGPLGNINTAQLNADVTQQAYTGYFGRRVLKQHVMVDVLGLARYTSLDANLKLAVTTGSDLLPDGSRSVGRRESWWDAAIATRVIAPVADKWDFVGYADIGAGGSDLTYQLMAGMNWQFSHMFSVKFGYRHFYQDYQKDDFKWDMTTSGVYAGLGIRF